MSKYVIIAKSKQDDGKGHYCILFHTRTKLRFNAPYLSLNLTKETATYYAVDKTDVPHYLRLAQQIRSERYNTPMSKRYDIFVIKFNSPKLQQFIKHNRTAKFAWE